MIMYRIRNVVIIAVILVAGCGREARITTTSPDALRTYTEGVSQWENFYYNEAKQSFEKALAADSTFAMAWCRLAMIDVATGNRLGARDMMSKALGYAPRATPREQLFIRMWHRQLEYDSQGAAGAADTLLQLYPDEKEAYLFRGALYEETEKNFDAAIRCYQHAIVVDSNYSRAVMSLGYAYSSLGDQDKAIEEMQRYIRLAPNVADPRSSYADLLLRAGRYDDALTQYQKSLELKPDYWYAFQKIGTIYAVLGRLAEAETQFRKSFSLLPGSAQTEAIFLGATAQLDLGRQNYSEAAAKFRRALVTDTTSVGASYGLMYTLGKMKKFAESESLLVRTTRELKHRNLYQSPAMLGFHLMKSRLLEDEGKLAKALAECDSAMEYSIPLTVAEVYRQRAEVQLAVGNFEPALDACEEALHTNPNSPAVLFTLTKVYHQKGDAAMTVEIGSRLLALWNDADPDFADRNELLRILGKKLPTAGPKPHQIESARALPEEFAISRFLS
jgi:tetratricopeptide (TPR) repeat protein